jgi:hypothetical protein
MSGPPQQTPEVQESGTQARVVIAALVIICTIVTLLVLGAIAINQNQSNALTLFNILLPVLATWVGTVLAFYFGRENFESASKQVRATNAQLIQIAQLTQEERARQPITQIMRPIAAITYEQLGGDRTAATVTLAQLRAKFTDTVTRLPVLTGELKPLYMIHGSSADKYLADPQHTATITLEQFINDQAQAGIFYDAQRGYALLAETASAADAKQSLEASTTVQDVLITTKGTADEPLVGWVSNTRLSKYLKT